MSKTASRTCAQSMGKNPRIYSELHCIYHCKWGSPPEATLHISIRIFDYMCVYFMASLTTYVSILFSINFWLPRNRRGSSSRCCSDNVRRCTTIVQPSPSRLVRWRRLFSPADPWLKITCHAETPPPPHARAARAHIQPHWSILICRCRFHGSHTGTCLTAARLESSRQGPRGRFPTLSRHICYNATCLPCAQSWECPVLPQTRLSRPRRLESRRALHLRTGMLATTQSVTRLHTAIAGPDTRTPAPPWGAKGRQFHRWQPSVSARKTLSDVP